MKKEESQYIRRGRSGGKWNTNRKWVGKGAKGVVLAQLGRTACSDAISTPFV